MTELNTRTIAQLVELHNDLAAKLNFVGHPKLSSWKRSKDLLIERIEEIQNEIRLFEVAETPAEENAEDTTENLTIGSVVSQLVLNPLLSYDQIVDMIRSQFPEANTSRRSVASVAARLRKDGVIVPLRRKKGPNEA